MVLYRFGINKVKLQHAAGYPPLSVDCGYTSTGICQHPLLHDLDGKSSATFQLFGDDVNAGNLYTSSSHQFNTKSQAVRSAARISAFKQKDWYNHWNSGRQQVKLYYNRVFHGIII